VRPLAHKEGSKSKSILSQEEFKAIFPPTLEVIYNTNETFLEKLEYRVGPWKIVSLCLTPLLQYPVTHPFLAHITKPTAKRNTTVGDIFVEMGPFFKCYTSYINSFDVARESIEKIRDSNSKFRDYLRVGFNISNYLYF
jgi:hypothetical protein